MSTTTTTQTIEIPLTPFAGSVAPSKSSLHHATRVRSSVDSSREAFAQPSPAATSLNATPSETTISSSSSTPKNSTLRTTITIFTPSLVNFLASFTNGLITIGLPAMARSIDLPRALYTWPTSVFSLTAGGMLLIAGSIADIIGARLVELLGIFFLGIFTLACGLSATGVQLVVFRAFQGIAMAMHLPASVALVANAVPSGRARNIGFGCLGLSQPLGFSMGLVISGVLVDRAGWRSGFYLSGGATLVTAVAAIWALPRVKTDVHEEDWKGLIKKMGTGIDWIGGLMASGGLAILAYVLAILSADLSTVRTPTTASLLALSVVLLAAFPVWMHYRTKAGKPALVPNALWKNIPFTSTCIMVAISYGVMNTTELFSSLYFQEIQDRTALTTSLYLLPNLLVGVVLNLTVGIFVDRVSARWLVVMSSFICALSPLLMALVNPAWSYWYLQFWAQVFAPFSGDVLFTVGLIIVSDNFPEKTQALAGAVFNTVSQFGMSLGMGVCQVVALGVMGKEKSEGGHGGGHGDTFDNMDKEDTLRGYRAAFWTMFGCMLLCGGIAIVGLRKAGKVGLKRE